MNAHNISQFIFSFFLTYTLNCTSAKHTLRTSKDAYAEEYFPMRYYISQNISQNVSQMEGGRDVTDVDGFKQYFKGSFSSDKQAHPSGTVEVQNEPEQGAGHVSLVLKDQGTIVETIPFSKIRGIKGVDFKRGYSNTLTSAVGIWYECSNPSRTCFYLLDIWGDIVPLTDTLTLLSYKAGSSHSRASNSPKAKNLSSHAYLTKDEQETICNEGKAAAKEVLHLGTAEFADCVYSLSESEAIKITGLIDKLTDDEVKHGAFLFCGYATKESARNCSNGNSGLSLLRAKSSADLVYGRTKGRLERTNMYVYGTGDVLDKRVTDVYFVKSKSAEPAEKNRPALAFADTWP